MMFNYDTTHVTACKHRHIWQKKTTGKSVRQFTGIWGYFWNVSRSRYRKQTFIFYKCHKIIKIFTYFRNRCCSECFGPRRFTVFRLRKRRFSEWFWKSIAGVIKKYFCLFTDCGYYVDLSKYIRPMRMFTWLFYWHWVISLIDFFLFQINSIYYFFMWLITWYLITTWRIRHGKGFF